jgi:uncharacterized cofD-like protein
MKWLVPGMNVKRWLFLLLIGVVGFALGAGLMMAYIYKSIHFQGVTSEVVYTATLQFIPRIDRAILLIGIGLMVVGASLVRLSHSLLSVFLPNAKNLAEVIYRQRKLPRGPRIVAIGGGTGLSNLLRGLKEYTSNLTAIVTVADEWARQNPLRQELGVIAPGDFRNCIVALSDEEPLMARLFQYRFAEGSGLEGHSFGNLFIAALAHITGSFEKALREVGRVLAVRGQILPSTLDEVLIRPDLGFQLEEGLPGLPPRMAKKVRLSPPDVVAHPEALRAIMAADLIVIGPGSIYSSVLPNLLVPGIREAIRSSRAVKIYVSNIATQIGDTENLDVLQHVEVVQAHVGEGLFDYVIANDNFEADMPSEWPAEMVRSRANRADIGGLRVVQMNVIDANNPWRHDPSKLSEGLLKVYYDQASRRSTQRQPSHVTARQPVEATQTA